MQTASGGAAREGRGGGDEGEERECVCGAVEGGWFAAAPGLHDREGLLHFGAGAATTVGASTGALLSAK